MKVHIINGPNLNMLGVRETGVYGTNTLEEINRVIQEEADKLDIEVSFFQSNYEGAVIDSIHSCFKRKDGIIINPGAFTHYSYAIRDAIAAVSIPTVEVHLSNIEERESFRKISVIKDVCFKQIMGKGINSYLEGLIEIKKLLEDKRE